VKNLMYRAYGWLVDRTGGPDQADRGDSPVPTAIIVAGLAAFAVVVVLAVTAAGDRFLDVLRNMTP
jgi:hypothetical protein